MHSSGAASLGGPFDFAQRKMRPSLRGLRCARGWPSPLRLFRKFTRYFRPLRSLRAWRIIVLIDLRETDLWEIDLQQTNLREIKLRDRAVV
jgi:hypothetical protein